MSWKAELGVDGKTFGLFKGLMIQPRDKKTAETNALVTLCEEGVKFTTCHVPHALTAHLFLPRTMFKTFELKNGSNTICICISNFIDLLNAEMIGNGGARTAGVSIGLEWSEETDFLAILIKGMDGCRVRCKLATFEPFHPIHHNSSSFDAFKLLMKSDQFKAIFGQEVNLKLTDRLCIQGCHIQEQSTMLLRLMQKSLTGNEIVITLTQPLSVNNQAHKWWESMQVDQQFEAVYRTDWLSLINSVSGCSERVALRSRSKDGLCEAQVLAGSFGNESAFLHYVSPALLSEI